MSRVVQVTETTSAHPESYDSTYSAYSVSNLDNGFADSTNTSYAQINLTRNANAVTQIYYNFNNLGIPSNATINSVSCSCKCSINTTSSSRVSTRQAQLFSGSTAMGTASNVPNSNMAFDISCGTWTAAQLANVKIRLYAVRGTSNTTLNYYFRFYGATLTVNYTYNQTEYEITCTSSVPAVHVGNATDYTQTYYKTAGSNQNIEIVGDLTGAKVTDNDVDITSSVSTMSGGGVITISNIQTDHTVLIFIPTNKIFIKVNGTWKEAADVLVKVNGTWKNVSVVHKNVNGYWQQQSDKSDMFDPDGLYVSGDNISYYGVSSFRADSVSWCMSLMSLSSVDEYIQALQSSQNNTAKPTLYTKTGTITFNNELYYTYSISDYNGSLPQNDYTMLIPSNFAFSMAKTIYNCNNNLTITQLPFYYILNNNSSVYKAYDDGYTRNLIDFVP